MVNTAIVNAIFVLSHINMANHRIDGHVDFSRIKHGHTYVNGIYFIS